MKTVVQRVIQAEVRVAGQSVGQVGPGIVALVGVEKGDAEADADVTARKIAALRIFEGRTPSPLKHTKAIASKWIKSTSM